MNPKIEYYLGASYYRKILDKLLQENQGYYRGVVLDLGGRDRGIFSKPKTRVQKWIFADLQKKHKPDLVLDAARMDKIKSKSIDVINATELFEHIFAIKKALSECFRVLKRGGVMILSAPFLCPMHPDPNDYQRWTTSKWKRELRALGFQIEKFRVLGRFFTVRADQKKAFLKSLPPVLKWPAVLFYPLYDLFTYLDRLTWIKNHSVLSKFHGGYFIIVRK